MSDVRQGRMQVDSDASLIMVAVSLGVVMASTNPPAWLAVVGLACIGWIVAVVALRAIRVRP